MPRRRPALAASRRVTALLALLLVAVAVIQPPGAGAQLDDGAGGSDYLTVAEVSPTVAPDGTWRAVLGVATEPPAGARLRSTVHQPLDPASARQRLADINSGGQAGPSLQNPVTRPIEELRRGSSLVVEVPIRPRSGDSTRLLVPNPGIHPVTVELVAPDDTVLQSIVLFLNRMPADASRPPLRVAPLLSVTSPPMVSQDGTVSLPPEGRESMEHAVDVLGASPAATVTVVVDPQLLDDAGRTGSSGDADLLDALVESIGRRPLLRRPWVPVHTESWAQASATSVVQSALDAGQATTMRVLGRRPDRATWPIDPNLGAQSVAFLRGLGIDQVVVRSDQLEAAAPAVTSASATGRFHLGSADSGVDALAVDATVDARLRDPALSAAMAVHLAVTELQAMWGAGPRDATGAAVVDLTAVPTAIAIEFLSSLADADDTAIQAGSVQQAFQASPASVVNRRRSEAVVRRLAPVTARTEQAIGRELLRLRDRANAYHSSIRDPGGIAPLDHLLLTTLHRDIDVADQLRYLAAVGQRIDADLRLIEPPPARSLTVTARTSRLPLRITNGTDRAVTVLLRFGGRRLEVNGGRPRRAVLQPGANSISVPVLARTSGEFTVRVELRTADDEVLLGTTSIRVRSTVVSGVGVLLGGGALAFLIVWWAVTIRRDRRRRRDDADEPAPPPSEAASVA